MLDQVSNGAMVTGSPYLSRQIRSFHEAALDRWLGQALREDRLFTFLQSMDCAVVLTDDGRGPSGPKVLFANPAYSKMTGFDLTDIIGRSPKLLHGPKTDLEAASRFRNDLERNRNADASLINYRRDGTRYLCRIFATQLSIPERSPHKFRIAFEYDSGPPQS